MPVWVVQIIIAVVMMVASYLLMPKPKQPQSSSTGDLNKPTADASRPVNVPFGTLTVKSPNCLWYGDIGQRTFEVSA